jgi:hypothetical protein
MATTLLPAFLRRTDANTLEAAAERTAQVRTERDINRLRALPGEEVYFFCKKISNDRLVREADPKAPSACWSAIGTACLAVALITGVAFPHVASTLAGYKLEGLRAEQRRLLTERRSLELHEAELTNINRLQQLAKDQNLTPPAPGQVVHLNGKDSSMAMNSPR